MDQQTQDTTDEAAEIHIELRNIESPPMERLQRQDAIAR